MGKRLFLSKKVLLASLFFLTGFIHVLHAQRNRYGMKLKEHKGIFQLANKEAIGKTVKDAYSHLPEDIYEPWKGYVPKLCPCIF
ncbi:hypothetical protein [Maribacter dokdonensis]|uniref:hypothetical protein n=1 Tax=Maribacter dokdonensis TaxID=320912 RepID=UPI0032971C1C